VQINYLHYFCQETSAYYKNRLLPHVICLTTSNFLQILLKGANGDELKKVKHVVQYGVFAAYHLALETSFLVDEGATLPELPLTSPIIVALPDKPSSADRSISTIPILSIPSASSPNSSLQAHDLQNDDLTFNSNKRMGQTSLGVRCDEINSQNGHITCLLDASQSSIGPLVQHSNNSLCHCPDCTRDVNRKMNLQDSQPGTTRNVLDNDFGVFPSHSTNLLSVKSDNSSTKNSEIGDKIAVMPAAPLNVQISHDDDSAKDNSVAKTDEIPASPADNQSILVSLSSRCVWKETLCERPHLLRIKYYGNFDKPLGRFLRDQLFDQVRLRFSYIYICFTTLYYS
jgi:1-phosphatidylinositol-3-phosphate 5-kinase